jgi:hypothetical protein
VRQLPGRTRVNNRQCDALSSTIAYLPPNQQLRPTAFGASTRGTSCQQSLWLLERVLPESAAAEAECWAARHYSAEGETMGL